MAKKAPAKKATAKKASAKKATAKKAVAKKATAKKAVAKKTTAKKAVAKKTTTKKTSAKKATAKKATENKAVATKDTTSAEELAAEAIIDPAKQANKHQSDLQKLVLKGSEFGRTTDPVRMYMREMGTVELLTREDEIALAKRIEAGNRQVSGAVSLSPRALRMLIDFADKIEAGEMKLTDMVVDFMELNALDDETVATPGEPGQNAVEAEESPSGPDYDEAVERFKRMRKIWKLLENAWEKGGIDSKLALKHRQALSDEMLQIKFVPARLEQITSTLRDSMDEVRLCERGVAKYCVTYAKVPRKRFLEYFGGNELNSTWIEKLIEASPAEAPRLSQYSDTIAEYQAQLIKCQQNSGLELKELKALSRKLSIGEAKARRAKKEMVEANLRLVISIAKKYTNHAPLLTRRVPFVSRFI